MSKLGGEPAYPKRSDFSEDGEVKCWGWPGLTKRELFAAMAMQGLEAGLGIESRRFELLIIIADSEGLTMAEAVAKESVVTADALIEELNK